MKPNTKHQSLHVYMPLNLVRYIRSDFFPIDLNVTYNYMTCDEDDNLGKYMRGHLNLENSPYFSYLHGRIESDFSDSLLLRKQIFEMPVYMRENDIRYLVVEKGADLEEFLLKNDEFSLIGPLNDHYGLYSRL